MGDEKFAYRTVVVDTQPCVFEMFATKSKLHINFQNLSGRGEEDETHMVTNLTLLQMSHITTLKGVK